MPLCCGCPVMPDSFQESLQTLALLFLTCIYHLPNWPWVLESMFSDFAVVSPRRVSWTVPAVKATWPSQIGLVNFRKRICPQHLSFHGCWLLSEYSKLSFLESQNREVKKRRSLRNKLSSSMPLFYRWGTWDGEGSSALPKETPQIWDMCSHVLSPLSWFHVLLTYSA